MRGFVRLTPAASGLLLGRMTRRNGIAESAASRQEHPCLLKKMRWIGPARAA